MHQGHAGLGIAVIVLAKLFGTALLGRLFVLTEPQLMQFAWFARALGWWRATQQRIKAALAQWTPWRRAHAALRRVRDWLRRRLR